MSKKNVYQKRLGELSHLVRQIEGQKYGPIYTVKLVWNLKEYILGGLGDMITSDFNSSPSWQKVTDDKFTEFCHWKMENDVWIQVISNLGFLEYNWRRQAIIWTSAGILLIGPQGTNFSEIYTGIQTFSFKNMHLKMSSVKRRQFCLGFKVIIFVVSIIGS